jgi:hypothetical protein
LIRKGEVLAGNTQYHMCDLGQVWSIVAKCKSKDLHHLFPPSVVEEITHDGIVLTFRPSNYSLSTNKCTSILWSPQISMSVTQRLYLAGKSNGYKGTSSGSDGAGDDEGSLANFTETPHIHIQCFDGVSKPAAEFIDHGHSLTKPLSEAHAPLDRIKLTKWPRRRHAKKKK